MNGDDTAMNNGTKGTLEIIVASVGLAALGGLAAFSGPEAFREIYEGVRTASTAVDHLQNVTRSLAWSLYPAATVASVGYLLRGIKDLNKRERDEK